MKIDELQIKEEILRVLTIKSLLGLKKHERHKVIDEKIKCLENLLPFLEKRVDFVFQKGDLRDNNKKILIKQNNNDLFIEFDLLNNNWRRRSVWYRIIDFDFFAKNVLKIPTS